MSGTLTSTGPEEPAAAAGAASVAGAGLAAGADGAAAAAWAGAAGAAAPSASSTPTTLPSDRRSPILTLTSRTTPAALDGTSRVALSDSRVTSPWSLATVSPTATSTSMTGTSL